MKCLFLYLISFSFLVPLSQTNNYVGTYETEAVGWWGVKLTLSENGTYKYYQWSHATRPIADKGTFEIRKNKLILSSDNKIIDLDNRKGYFFKEEKCSVSDSSITINSPKIKILSKVTLPKLQ